MQYVCVNLLGEDLLGEDLYFILVFDTEDIMHESECLFEKKQACMKEMKKGEYTELLSSFGKINCEYL